MAKRDSTEGGAEQHPDRMGRRPLWRPRTDTEEADCGSSNGVPSTPQSVNDYALDDTHSTPTHHGDFIAWTGEQFQSPASTPPRDVSMQPPSLRSSRRIPNAPLESKDTAGSSDGDGGASAQGGRGLKRRGSDLEETKNGGQYLLHRHAARRKYGASLESRPQTANQNEPDKTAAGDNASLTSHTDSSVETEGDDMDSLSEDEDTYDHESVVDEDDAEETDGPSTPRG